MLKDLSFYQKHLPTKCKVLNKLTLVDAFRFVFNNLLLLIALGLLHTATHLLALEFEVYKGWSSWYWPIGVQVACYILMPFRYWLVIMLAIPMGGIFEHIIVYDGSYTDPGKLRTFLEPFTLLKFSQLVFIAFLKVRIDKLTLEKVKPMLFIMAVAASYRLIVSVRNILTESFFDVPKDRIFEMILAQFLGGFLTILIVVPFTFLIVKAWQNRNRLPWRKAVEVLIYLSVLIFVTLIIYYLQPKTLYLLRILAFIPLIWFSYQFGWEGAIAAMLTINGLICYQVFGLNDTATLVEAELYIISIAMTGIVLGSVMAEQKSMNNTLSYNNEKLSSNNEKLKKMVYENQLLSKKLITSKEEERQKFSHELHGEVGQNLTALKVQLKLLEKQFDEMDSAISFGKVNRGANQVYESIYKVLTGLQHEEGKCDLLTQLKSGKFEAVLSSANIHYHCEIVGDVAQAGENTSSVVLHIVQESVNNCIKHSKANNFYLFVAVNENGVELKISDDGMFRPYSSGENSGGFGLKLIEKQVLALKGKFSQNDDNGSFQLSVLLPYS